MVARSTFTIETKGRLSVTNVTDRVLSLLREMDVREGNAILFAGGSTAAITTIEYEQGLIKDIMTEFDRLFPYGKRYAHHETWGCDNGSSHLLSALLKPSFAFPVVDGAPLLGTWQQIVFIECDTRPRSRTLTLQVVM